MQINHTIITCRKCQSSKRIVYINCLIIINCSHIVSLECRRPVVGTDRQGMRTINSSALNSSIVSKKTCIYNITENNCFRIINVIYCSAARRSIAGKYTVFNIPHTGMVSDIQRATHTGVVSGKDAVCNAVYTTAFQTDGTSRSICAVISKICIDYIPYKITCSNSSTAGNSMVFDKRAVYDIIYLSACCRLLDSSTGTRSCITGKYNIADIQNSCIFNNSVVGRISVHNSKVFKCQRSRRIC